MYSKNDFRKESMKFFNNDELASDSFKKYALTTKTGEYLEVTPEETWARMANAASAIEKDKTKWNKKFLDVFSGFKAVPQGSIMFALGNTHQKSSCSNCFVFELEDNLESIFEAAKEMARTYSYRGGCGLDLSPLRPNNAIVTNAAKSSSGAASFMDFYSTVTKLMGIHNRRGALMLTLSVDHPDIENFIKMKHDKTKVTGANVSIKILDKFMKAVQNDEVWVTSFKTQHETIKKEWKAKDLWKIIVDSATGYAEPGILFWDNIINNSPADCYSDLGFKTICTNPCAELPLSRYDSCTLLSMNLTKYTKNDFKENSFFDEKTFFEDVYVATRFLDNVKTLDADLVPLPQQKEISIKGRRIGMGIHGLADAMANLRIKYDSEKGVDFIDKLFEKYTKTVYSSSVELAKEKGAFPIFDAKRERGHKFLERIGFAGVPRRNIACMTLAPTGTVSIVSQTSSGIEPVFANEYTRKRKINHNEVEEITKKLNEQDEKWRENYTEKKKLKVDGRIISLDKTGSGEMSEEYKVYHRNAERYLQMTEEKELPNYFVTSDQIDWKKRVQIQASITKWLDHSCSSTVNLPKGTSSEIVGDIYMEAWKSGCKGMTVYVDGCRDGILTVEEKEPSSGRTGPHDAIARPAKVPCDIYQITADGEKWVVLVGLVNDKPYEVFCGKPKKIDIGKVEKGYIEKESRGKYSLHIGDDTVLRDISDIFNDIQGSITRLISTSLRHGVDIQFVVQQIEKSDGTITSFNKAISRVLKKYIKDGTKEDGAKCIDCGQESLIREDGCVKCISCGWTKCS